MNKGIWLILSAWVSSCWPTWPAFADAVNVLRVENNRPGVKNCRAHNMGSLSCVKCAVIHSRGENKLSFTDSKSSLQIHHCHAENRSQGIRVFSPKTKSMSYAGVLVSKKKKRGVGGAQQCQSKQLWAMTLDQTTEKRPLKGG